MKGLFKAFCGDFLFNKKFFHHSAFLPAVCSTVIYKKGSLRFDLEQSQVLKYIHFTTDISVSFEKTSAIMFPCPPRSVRTCLKALKQNPRL